MIEEITMAVSTPGVVERVGMDWLDQGVKLFFDCTTLTMGVVEVLQKGCVLCV